MAHKSEFVADNEAGNGGGYKVKNGPTESTVISQSGEVFSIVAGTNDPTAEGQMTYISGTGYRLRDSSGVFTIPRSGGAPGSSTLDSAYENGTDVQIDLGATTWTDSTAGALNSFELVKDGAGSGNLLDLSIDAAATGNALAIDMNLGIAATGIFIDNGGTARTGSDILVTDDSTGAHSVIDINSSGSGASIGLDWTGSYNGSPGGSSISLTFDNADNLDTNGILITRGTGIRTAPAINIDEGSTGSADIIDIDVTGVYTGDVIDITTSAAATGNALFINLDSAVAMTAIHIEGSGVRTQPYIELITDSTSSASLIDISVDGAITGTAAIDIDMNAGLAANAIFIDAGGGIRTADLISITDDGSGNVDALAITASNTGSGSVMDINVSGIRTGNIIDIAMSAAATSTGVIAIDLDAAVAAAALFLDAGNAARTADIIDCTFDGSGNVSFLDLNCTNTGSGNLLDVAVTGVHTGNALNIAYSSAASTGNAIDITTGTNLAGNAIAITTAGARTSPVVFIDGASTDAGTDDHIIDINQSGVLNSNIIDITYSVGASDGNAIDINMGTNIAGSAVDINATGARSGPLFNIVSNATDAGTDDHTLFITQSGIQDSNMIQLTYDTAASTGNAVAVAMGTNVAGMAFSLTSAGTGVSGEGVGLNMAHTGNLVAGADLVRLESTGSPSSTSNILAIEQNTGAGSAGAFGLYINCTGTNVEAIKVDAGTVTFDETLTVTGLTTLTAGVTGKWIRAGITSDTGAHAIPVTGSVHEVTTTGTGDALTLANGTAGQRLSVIYVAEGAGADTAVITPTTFAGGSTITLNALGDSVDLVYSSTGGWYVLGLGGSAAVA